MNASVRRVAAGIADAVIEGTSMAVTLLGGVLGTYVSYRYSPGSWPMDTRLVIAGAVAVISAISLYSLAELILAPLRRLTVKTRTTTDHGRKAAPAAPTPWVMHSPRSPPRLRTTPPTAPRTPLSPWTRRQLPAGQRTVARLRKQ